MSKSQKYKLQIDFILLLLLRVFNIILPIVTAPYLARVFGPTGIGTNTFYFSIAQYFSLFIIMGINYYGTNQCSKVKNDKRQLSIMFKKIFTLQIFLLVIVVIIYLVTGLIISTDQKILFFVYAIFLISVGIDISWLFQAKQSFSYIVTRSFLIKIISTILIFTLVKDIDDLVVYALIIALSSLLSNLLLWIKTPSIIEKVNYKANYNDMKSTFKPILLLFVPVLSVSIYKIIDKLMIGLLSTRYELGLYESSEKLITLVLGITTTLGIIMLPRISELLSKKDDKSVSEIFNKSIVFIFFLSLPATAILVTVSDIFVPIFYGETFGGAIPILILLSFTVPMVSLGNVIVTQYFIPFEKNRFYIISVLVGAIINFGLNLLLIIPYGAIGAAIATLVTEFAVITTQLIVTRKLISWKLTLCALIYFIIISLSFYVIKIYISKSSVFYELNSILLLLIIVFTGTIVYLLLSFIFYSLIFKKTIKDITRGVI